MYTPDISTTLPIIIMFNDLDLQSTNMSTNSPGTPESGPPPQPKAVVPHVLCDCCSRIVKKSKMIQALAEDRLPQYEEEEYFFLNRSLTYPLESSAAGCHLCSLGLSRLSHTCYFNGPTFWEDNAHSIISVEHARLPTPSGMSDVLYLRFWKCTCIDVAEELLNDFNYMDSTIERLLFQQRGLSPLKDLEFVHREVLQLRKFQNKGGLPIILPWQVFEVN